jgi:hypothetical protein
MSVQATKGVVEKKYVKDWYDAKKKENIILHSFRLQGDKTYYRTGQSLLPANEGDAVEFEYDDRSGNVFMDTVTEAKGVVERAPAAPRRDTGGRTGSYSGGAPAASAAGSSRDNYWKDKEDRDMLREKRYQEVVEPRMIVMAAQERAVGVVAAALANDCLSFGNTAKGAKYEMLLNFVDEATEHFVKQSLNATEICEDAGDNSTPKSEVYDD